jgi:hypothetical protein
MNQCDLPDYEIRFNKRYGDWEWDSHGRRIWVPHGDAHFRYLADELAREQRERDLQVHWWQVFLIGFIFGGFFLIFLFT